MELIAAETASSRLRWLGFGCVLVFLGLSLAGFAVLQLEADERDASHDRVTVARATEVRAELGDQLSRSVNLARGLRAYVVAYPDLGDEERVDTLLEQLYEQGSHIRNIGVAPDNVIRTVHPLEGNEEAIGLDYRDVPDQYPAVELAVETGETVLAGPVDLVQGGRGLIDRTPVFLADGSYWGVVSLVLDVESLLQGVADEVGPVGLEWGLRTVGNEIQPSTPVGGDPEVFDRADAVLTLAVPSGEWELAVRSPRETNGFLYFLAHVAVIALSGVIAWLVFSATRERWRSMELSLSDALTGLANRRCLEERADRALARSQREDVPTSLIYVDLDDFKPINDTHGHVAGDVVLRTLAARFRERVRDVDTVARVGGDEFVVLMPDTGASGVEKLAGELRALVEEPVAWSGHDLRVGASIGTSVHPVDGATLDDLLIHADRAMYDAKRDRQPDEPSPSQ